MKEKATRLQEKAKAFRMKIKLAPLPDSIKGSALSFLNEVIDFFEEIKG